MKKLIIFFTAFSTFFTAFITLFIFSVSPTFASNFTFTVNHLWQIDSTHYDFSINTTPFNTPCNNTCDWYIYDGIYNVHAGLPYPPQQFAVNNTFTGILTVGGNTSNVHIGDSVYLVINDNNGTTYTSQTFVLTGIPYQLQTSTNTAMATMTTNSTSSFLSIFENNWPTLATFLIVIMAFFFIWDILRRLFTRGDVYKQLEEGL